MIFPRSILVIPVFGLFLVSCGETKDKSTSDSAVSPVTASGGNQAPSAPPTSTSQNIEVKTFEVKDSVGKSHGWGYDLYVDGKRSIHQPIIPAVPGNDAFGTETDAEKIGELAALKMKTTGSLPTISIHDLDSLGIKHQ